MKRTAHAAAATIALLCAGAPAHAQQDAAAAPSAPPASCSEAEFRQMDFWAGEWNLSWDNGDGTRGHGTNSITKDEFGTCVIFEHFNGPGLKGMSVSTYHKPTQQWRQTWVDDQGGYFALTGGPADGADHDFELNLTRLSDTAPFRRMIWQNVTPDSFTWRWQGRPTDDVAWNDLWVIDYERASPDETAG